jgi:hypothetical protein
MLEDSLREVVGLFIATGVDSFSDVFIKVWVIAVFDKRHDFVRTMILDSKCRKLNVLIAPQGLMPLPSRPFKALPKDPNGHHIILNKIFREIILICVDKFRALKFKVALFSAICAAIIEFVLVFLKDGVVLNAEELLLV